MNYGVDYQNGGTCHFSPIPDTWIKMLDILLFWASKDIDGFRCDMAEMVPVEFWEWAIPQVKEASTKNFYIIIKKINFNKDMDNFESIICDELNEKFLKIKDCLSRCGNNVINILEKEEIKKILFSFLNSQKFIFE